MQPQGLLQAIRFSSSVDLAEVVEANSRCHGDVLLKNTEGGRGYGVFAARNFEPGETVIRAKPLTTTFSEPHSHSIQVGWRKHALVDLPSRFLNHMCDPNMRLKPNDKGAYDFLATRSIEANDEVGFDYETCEYELEEPIACECGAHKCRKLLKGFRYNGKQVLETHGELFVAPHLLSADTPKK